MAHQDNHPITVMLPEQSLEFSFHEFCERGEVHGEFVVKLVNYGVIAPVRECVKSEWCFDLAALQRLRKAQRLQRDLKMNLPGLALSLELLDDVNRLEREVQQLRQQLRQLLGE
ncbi:MAG: chaperone modulator CbpM [Marinobacter sp.]|nr:chaperone modulator CbpM [Marinobacter sp.]